MSKLYTGPTIALIIGLILAPGAMAQQVADSQETEVTHKGALVATGKVVGPHSEPQAGVPVVVSGPKGAITSAFTDADGQWSVYNLPAGTYQVQPPKGMTRGSKTPITFSVPQTDWFGSLFGAEKKPAYVGQIMLDQDFKQQK